MLELITRGIGLGFGAGSTPGPFMSYLIATTLSRGWKIGMVVILAPLVSDLPIIIITTLLLAELSNSVISVMQIVGGLFVLYIAWGAWGQYRAGETFVSKTDKIKVGERGVFRQTLRQAVMMNLLSPGPYLFWGTVNGPLLRDGLDQSLWHGIAFLVAFYGTFIGMMAGMVLVFDRLRTLDEQVTKTIILIAIVVLGVLGVSLILEGTGVT